MIFPHVSLSLQEDLHTHSTCRMQIISETRFNFPHCVMRNVLFPKVITIFKLIFLFWFKMEQINAEFGVTCSTSASVLACFLSPFPGSSATWLRSTVSSTQDTFNVPWVPETFLARFSVSVKSL